VEVSLMLLLSSDVGDDESDAKLRIPLEFNERCKLKLPVCNWRFHPSEEMTDAVVSDGAPLVDAVDILQLELNNADRHTKGDVVTVDRAAGAARVQTRRVAVAESIVERWLVCGWVRRVADRVH
jgi:hypothetical protein